MLAMKTLFFSDSHGCAGALRELDARIVKEAPDTLVFLGDSLYHGPRNAIQGDYDPQKASALFNSWVPRLLAVRGNCDAEVDQMLLHFPIQETSSTLWADGLCCFLTHGHIWGPDHLPPFFQGHIIASGHTHIPMLQTLPSGIVALNPGSIALPKGGSIPSYAVLQDRTLSLRDLYSGTPYQTLEIPSTP